MSDLKVIHLSTNDIVGGAARAVYRLHTGLRSYGCNSTMVVANKKSNDPTVIPVIKSHRIKKYLGLIRKWKIQKMRKQYPCRSIRKLPPFRDHRSFYTRMLVKQIVDADVLHLHFLKNLLTCSSRFTLVLNKCGGIINSSIIFYITIRNGLKC